MLPSCPLTCTTQWSKTIIERIKNLADTNFDAFNFCDWPHPRKLSAREKNRLYGITIITIQQAYCIYLQMQLSMCVSMYNYKMGFQVQGRV